MLIGLSPESGGVSGLRLHACALPDNVEVIFQQHRPGPPLPKGESYLTIGWKQIWAMCKQYKQLPYTFIYLFAFFLLADVGSRIFYDADFIDIQPN